MPNENLTDVEFIGERVLWFLKLTPEEFMAHIRANPRDGFHSIPNPNSGGMIIIGREAGQRFWKIAERHLASHPDRKTRTNLSSFVEQLRDTFSQLFLQEGREINQSTVDRWISIAYRATARAHETATHYIPCALVFSDSLKQVVVGPVTFYHETEFFRLHGGEIEKLRETIRDDHRKNVEAAIVKGFPQKDAATPEQSALLGDRLTDGLLEVFKRYQWFAVVNIPAADKEVSYDRALFATRGALNIIKLLLGSDYTHRLRTVGDYGHAGNAATLTRDTAGELHISLSSTPTDHVVGDEWLKKLDTAGRFFTLPCRVLTLCSGFHPAPPLCARYLDALTWFGDAVAERSPAAKIVKFVTAIERLCGTGNEKDDTGKERGVTDIVTSRAAIFYSVVTGIPFDRACKEVTKIYDCRSDVVHGSVSPYDDKVAAEVARTDEIARMVLLGAIDYYKSISLEDPANTEKGLRAHFQKLEEWNADGRLPAPSP